VVKRSVVKLEKDVWPVSLAVVTSNTLRNNLGYVYSCRQREFVSLVYKNFEVGADKKGHARKCTKPHNYNGWWCNKVAEAG
jgi:hypothetical protein